MKAEYRFLLFFCGFAAIFASISFLLVPSIADLRASQTRLQNLEARVRLLGYELAETNDALDGADIRILSKDEYFSALANIRAASLKYGLSDVSFTGLVVYSFDMGVSETIVRVSLTGSFDDVVDYLYYLAGGVYNIRYLSLVSAEPASFEFELSIFHE